MDDKPFGCFPQGPSRVVSAGGRGVEPLPLQRGGEFRGESGAFPFEGGDVVDGAEFEAHLCARHGGARGRDDQREVGGLHGTLQPVPLLGGESPQIGGGRAAEIEDDEAEIGVPGKEIGGVERGGGAGAAHPYEMGEQIAGKRRRVERVGAVDQRDAGAGGARDDEQLAEQQLTAATGPGADDFRNGAQWQPAGGVIEGRDPRGQQLARRARRDRKALGEEMPERLNSCGDGGHEWKSGGRRPEVRGQRSGFRGPDEVEGSELTRTASRRASWATNRGQNRVFSGFDLRFYRDGLVPVEAANDLARPWSQPTGGGRSQSIGQGT